MVSFVGFAANDYYIMRDSTVKNLRTQATTMAFNSTGVLSFHDATAAHNLLISLQSQPTIELACLYDSEGKAIAAYRSQAIAAAEPPPPQDDGYSFTSEHTLDMFVRVMDGHEFVGTLFLRENVSRLNDQLLRLHRSRRRLDALFVDRGGIAGDRACSAPSPSRSSIWPGPPRKSPTWAIIRFAYRRTPAMKSAASTATFNDMLERVETGEKQLLAAHEVLEDRVLERTAQLRQEIAQRERTQLDLERACDEAQAAARAKSEFLANMSHEIRTPITAILGYVEILLEEHKDKPGGMELSVIERNSHHLLGIINDILDISKIEAHRMSVENIPCSIVQIIAEVHSLMQVRTLSKGLNFHVEFTTAIPKMIQTDPTRLRQILINLTSNAVKFTKKGEVKLLVSFQGGEKPSMQFDIFDTGIGMNEEEIKRLFQNFSQADTSMTRRFGGTGLGLCISKRLAEMLGGDVVLGRKPPRPRFALPLHDRHVPG